MKTCIRCKKEKPLAEYYKNKLNKDGLYPHCKSCQLLSVKKYRKEHPDRHKAQEKKWRDSENHKKYDKKYREDNKKAIAEKGKIYREENFQKEKARKKKWRKENRDKEKEYYANRKDITAKKSKEWREKNRDKLRIQQKERGIKNRKKLTAKYLEWHHKKMDSDIDYRTIKLLRGRISKFLFQAGNQKNKKSELLLGCDWKTAINYLNNLGYKKGMHIDHIIPLSIFDVMNENHKRIMFNYRNLQPLSPYDNLSKGDKLPGNWKNVLKNICKELNIDYETVYHRLRGRG